MIASRNELMAIVVLTLFMSLDVFCPAVASSNSHLATYKSGKIDIKYDLVIEGEPADESYLLVTPMGFAVGPTGYIYVVELTTHEILVFDDEGVLVNSFGGYGEGPGEFQVPIGVEIGPSGDVIVYDINGRRFTTFDKDGNYIDSQKIRDNVVRFGVTSGGSIIGELFETKLVPNVKQPELIKIIGFSQPSGRSVVVDSAFIDTDDYISEPVRINVPVPFRPGLFWGVSPNGNLVVSRSEDYSVRILSSDFVLIKSFTHDCKRVRVTDEDQEEYFSGIGIKTNEVSSRGAPDYIREATSFPDSKPCFKRMLIDDDGFLLFELFEQEGDESVFDVFTGEGEYVGRVTVPLLGAFPRFVNGKLYCIRADEEEIPNIERGSLVPAR